MCKFDNVQIIYIDVVAKSNLKLKTKNLKLKSWHIQKK